MTAIKKATWVDACEFSDEDLDLFEWGEQEATPSSPCVSSLSILWPPMGWPGPQEGAKEGANVIAAIVSFILSVRRHMIIEIISPCLPVFFGIILMGAVIWGILNCELACEQKNDWVEDLL